MFGVLKQNFSIRYSQRFLIHNTIINLMSDVSHQPPVMTFIIVIIVLLLFIYFIIIIIF